MATVRINMSLRSYQRLLRACEHLKFVKRKHMPKLLPRHRQAQLDDAKKHIRSPPKWRRIIWSDEKKFNLDGPDGFKYYLHDLRHEKEEYFTRHSGGGSVMIWGRKDAIGYIDTRQDYLFPSGYLHYGGNFTFMQDGASIHQAHVVKDF
ncbi:Aste57867_3757 [Aphanomyces stellatus]|uniref:Aste57867_3757 protein n=1 Tax=Aphanomyces stellatus TaxID=120398 RepID=A0A485KAA2_9STRA|nr:hypothetical protein As57867_003746 [Aphanomyces stellatus]VFT80908.1 Aste57867_3757 [Aphanomyces stellatus]